MADAIGNYKAIAEAYADALTPLATQADALELVLVELEGVRELTEQIGLVDWCDSPLVPLQRKCDLIEQAFRTRVSDLTCDLLGVITRRGRWSALRWIVAAYRRQALELLGRVLVKVTTATPLEERTRQRILDVLTQRLDGEPVLDEHVDPRIVGGVVIQTDDEVLDLSVESEMDQMNRNIAQWLVRVQAGRERRPGLEAESE